MPHYLVYVLFVALILAIMVACSVTLADTTPATMPTTAPAALPTEAQPDPRAVYLDDPQFHAKADGTTDDSAALQAGIDAVQTRTRKGILFVPPGRYLISRTIHVWDGIRLIGLPGKPRPVIVLRDHAPDFQAGEGKYMLYYCAGKPAPGQNVRDGNPGTFYSGLSGIDLEVGAGNPAAACVRFHVAQHCLIAHVEFRIGSGRTGIDGAGNETDDCRFLGGDFGVTTSTTAPSWPFLLIDSSFEGQRKAAIDTDRCGMTVVRASIKNVPTAVNIHENRWEELWLKDCRLENITGPAMVISEENNPRTKINMQGVVCKSVPVLASFRLSGRQIAGPSEIYNINEFSHGMHMADLAALPELKTTSDIVPLSVMPAPIPSDVPPLPVRDTWVNILTLGAKGDGVTDDTAVFKDAIANHRVIYLPTGRFRVTDTLLLKPDTVLIGLSPFSTQILLTDNTPGFTGEGGPKPLLETPAGGNNIVSGIGLDSGYNTRAVAARWLAGTHSLMNDVRFVGGHGTYNADGSSVEIYNNNRTADFDPQRRWDTQYPSLWITDGGGGTFKDIWSPNPWAQAGVYISNTDTPGRLYAVSVEHHVRNEVKLRNVSNWQIYALQTEEERGEGTAAYSLDLDNCSNITFANLDMFRVTIPTPFPYAMKIHASKDISIRAVRIYSPAKTPFDNTIYDVTHRITVPWQEIASLTISAGTPVPQPLPEPEGVLAPGAKLEKLASGFESIEGAVADPAGNVWFVDTNKQRIYRYTPDTKDLAMIYDSPIQPMLLACDTAGHMLVVSSPPPRFRPTTRPAPATASTTLSATAPAPPRPQGPRRPNVGAIYTLNTDTKNEGVTAIKPIPSPFPDGAIAFHPLPWSDPANSDPNAPPPAYTLAPDAKTIIPSNRGLYDAVQLRAAIPGQPFYLPDAGNHKTWAFTVNPDGTLTHPKLFAEEGEGGLAVDSHGNVYLAAGAVFVYDPTGKRLGMIAVPEHPTSLVFGGADGKTLFITARTSLYAIKTATNGR